MRVAINNRVVNLWICFELILNSDLDIGLFREWSGLVWAFSGTQFDLSLWLGLILLIVAKIHKWLQFLIKLLFQNGSQDPILFKSLGLFEFMGYSCLFGSRPHRTLSILVYSKGGFRAMTWLSWWLKLRSSNTLV